MRGVGGGGAARRGLVLREDSRVPTKNPAAAVTVEMVEAATLAEGAVADHGGVSDAASEGSSGSAFVGVLGGTRGGARAPLDGVEGVLGEEVADPQPDVMRCRGASIAFPRAPTTVATGSDSDARVGVAGRCGRGPTPRAAAGAPPLVMRTVFLLGWGRGRLKNCSSSMRLMCLGRKYREERGHWHKDKGLVSWE